MTSPKSRPLWVGTSWKMNKTLAEADSFVEELLTFPVPSGIQAFLVPPHTALARVRDRLPADSPVLLGAQNAHWAAEGSLERGASLYRRRRVVDCGSGPAGR